MTSFKKEVKFLVTRMPKLEEITKSVSVLLFVLISFHSMGQVRQWTLDECIDEAIKNNLTVAQVATTNETNRVSIFDAQGNRVPTLNGNAAQNFQMGHSMDPSTNQFVKENYHTNTFSLTSGITLFNGFQNLNTVKQARINYQSGSYDIAKAKNDVALSVTAGYLQVLLGYEQADNYGKQIQYTQAMVEKTQKQIDAGSLAEVNIYTIKSQLATDNYNFVNAKSQLMIYKVNLQQLMNMPVVDSFEIERPVFQNIIGADTVLSREDVYNYALKNQPQIKSYALKSKSALVGLQIARGGAIPRLTFNSSISTNYSSTNTLTQIYSGAPKTVTVGYVNGATNMPVINEVPTTISSQNPYPFNQQLKNKVGETFSFNLVVPILNNFNIRAAIMQAKVNMKLAKINEDTQKMNLRQSIEQAYVDYKTSYANYKSSLDQFAAWEKSYNIAVRKLALGAFSDADYLLDKNNYVQGQSIVVQAKYNFIFKTMVLNFYHGKPLSFNKE